MSEITLSFKSNTMALKADRVLSQEGIAHSVIPSPRRCGLCIRFSADLMDTVYKYLREGGVTWITQN